jgi:hypothetical protein
LSNKRPQMATVAPDQDAGPRKSTCRTDTLVRFFAPSRILEKVKRNVEGGGQECPPYTTGSCPYVDRLMTSVFPLPDTHISKSARCGAPGIEVRKTQIPRFARDDNGWDSDGDREGTEILRWQAFALRRPALPQDDGGLRMWLTSDTHISKSARCGAPGFF